jgi:hypothetical protein
MNQNKRPVSVEGLLRVKRAEQPPPEFWNQFEREMRIRQLAAIVEPRPWWAPFIRVGARVSRYQLPIGAAAILALSFVTIREYRTGDLQPTFAPEVRAPELAIAAPASVGGPIEVTTEDEAPNAEPVAAPSATTPHAPADVAAVGRVSHATPLIGVLPERELSPSERYIAANLAAAKAADPMIVDEVFSSPVRMTENREPVRDPLIQVASLGDTRRSRLLTTALPPIGGNGDVSVGTSARVARRLTEDRLYDSIRRIGVKGDRVAIKF